MIVDVEVRERLSYFCMVRKLTQEKAANLALREMLERVDQDPELKARMKQSQRVARGNEESVSRQVVLAWLTCGTPPLIYTCYIPNGIFGNSTHPHFDIFIVVPLNLVFSHILTQHRLRMFSAIGSNHLQGIQHVLFTFVHQSLSIHQGDIGRSPLKALQGGQGNAKAGHPDKGEGERE